MHAVKRINSIDGYKLNLTFNDNKTKIVDVEAYLDKGIFLIVKDPGYFKKVKIIGSTIAWPNGADFCPDTLYEIGVEVKSQARRKRSQPRRRVSSSFMRSQSNITAQTKKTKIQVTNLPRSGSQKKKAKT